MSEKNSLTTDIHYITAGNHKNQNIKLVEEIISVRFFGRDFNLFKNKIDFLETEKNDSDIPF